MPRLGSKKSRTGCKQCKQKRVKCDEKVPCSRCARRDELCSFLEPSPSVSSETTSPGPLPDSDDWILDLELMHHYTTVLSSLGVREKVAHIWRDYITQQALKHTFLMRGLLAFAALHLAYLKPENSLRYLRVCDKHQDVALQKFRSILSAPADLEYADALLALSATLSLSSMARSCALSKTATMEMSAVSELFVLTKGVANVLNLSRPQILESPLAEMLENQRAPPDATVHLPIRVSSRFEAIRLMLSTYGLEREALELCQSALSELEKIYKNIVYFSAISDIEIGMVSQWQVTVPMGYVRLIENRIQPALVVLAYYAAAITAVHKAWYTQNWAEYALRGISESLEENMLQWIEWPKLQVQEQMSELGVQSPLEEITFSNSIANLQLN